MTMDHRRWTMEKIVHRQWSIVVLLLFTFGQIACKQNGEIFVLDALAVCCVEHELFAGGLPGVGQERAAPHNIWNFSRFPSRPIGWGIFVAQMPAIFHPGAPAKPTDAKGMIIFE